jgi:ribonuclease HI
VKLRAITDAEIEASHSPRGGLTAKQLKLWGVSWPPPKGWRRKILRNGVPASCPMPAGFDPVAARAEPPQAPRGMVSEVCHAARQTTTATVADGLKYASRTLEAEAPADAIEIFTDGGCDPNPGAGGWGFAVFRGAEELHSACGGGFATTNNRMEITALIQALRWLDPKRPAIVWSDSRYVVDGSRSWRHGWKAKGWKRGKQGELLNSDLWIELDALLDARLVDVRWLRSHVGTVGNERADELATLGRQELLDAA